MMIISLFIEVKSTIKDSIANSYHIEPLTSEYLDIALAADMVKGKGFNF